MPEQFWKLTFTEFALLVENYYHKQDLQTIQTRELLAVLYNVNRGKLPSKTAKELMPTFEESERNPKKGITEDPEETIKKVKEKYGGKASSL